MKERGGPVTTFDPKLTFETFVVGPANRLAAAAARRAADSPGAGYNPLFLYSASGLGKSHILSAIAHQALRGDPGRTVLYQTLEGFLDDLTRSLEEGGTGAGGDRYADADILLLDDVQFLTGQPQAQEMLLRTLDALTARGAQVVLASDRPPAEINGLDARLLSRFSGGLIVDIGLPDYEMRVAIMRRKVEDRGARMAEGVIEALARHPFRNVRELQGALNRLLALQELEERLVRVGELSSALGPRFADVGTTPAFEGGDGSAENASGPGPEWRRAFREAIHAVEAAGFAAHRLRRYLVPGLPEPVEWTSVLHGFRRDLDRLREIRSELEQLGEMASPETDALLADPDLLEEAERRLVAARERGRGFQALPPGPVLAATGERFPLLARRAAERAMAGDHPEYNPLFVHATDGALNQAFLEACGRTYLLSHPDARVGLLPFPEFSEELIRALSDGVADPWRDRWWSVDLLLLHQVEQLGVAERAQEEFFHLFEALKRRGARIFLAADRPASELNGVDDRLRSRFEGGLVVELSPTPSEDRGWVRIRSDRSERTGGNFAQGVPSTAGALERALAEVRALSGDGSASGSFAPPAVQASAASTEGAAPASELVDDGEDAADEGSLALFQPDRAVWQWPHLEDRILEEDA
jgi:chromosomal replication initiator protein